MIDYEIKFKRFIDGVWDGKFRTARITADNEYQAVYQLGVFNDDNRVEDIIVMVHSQTGNPSTFMPGNTYTMLNGDKIKTLEFKDLNNVNGLRTIYETIMDEKGCHRYSRRDIGRVTGCHSNNPKNIQLGVFWMRMDKDDPYDYIMERKHD